MTRRRNAGRWALLSIAFVGAYARADIDTKLAMPMLLKALPYDTNFDTRGS